MHTETQLYWKVVFGKQSEGKGTGDTPPQLHAIPGYLQRAAAQAEHHDVLCCCKHGATRCPCEPHEFTLTQCSGHHQPISKHSQHQLMAGHGSQMRGLHGSLHLARHNQDYSQSGMQCMLLPCWLTHNSIVYLAKIVEGCLSVKLDVLFSNPKTLEVYGVKHTLARTADVLYLSLRTKTRLTYSQVAAEVATPAGVWLSRLERHPTTLTKLCGQLRLLSCCCVGSQLP